MVASGSRSLPREEEKSNAVAGHTEHMFNTGTETDGRHGDQEDLLRLGVRQETKRRFGLVAILALTSSMMGTWEGSLAFFVTPFINGGGVMMMYGYIVAFLGALATCASLAEIASMYPISGGQYFFVAILAPPKHAKFLSFLTGWISMLGWQAATAVGTYVCSNILLSLVSFNTDYEPQRWQATLLLYAILLLVVIANTVLIRLLPGIEKAVLILHVIGWFAIIIPVVHLAPKSTNKFVWEQFTVVSGYSNGGLAWMVGQSLVALLFIGYDGAMHMAEEVRNASVNVPRAMIFTICLNGVLGFATYLVLLYCLGDPDVVLDPKYSFAFVPLFDQATKSKAGTTVMGAILIVMFTGGTLGFFASSSRQAWALARNGGLPFSNFLKRVDSRFHIPMWAILLTTLFNVALGLINIGSAVVFGAITSLVVSSFLTSYLIPILLLIRKRIRGEKIDFGPWNLGRLGLPVNVFAAIYTLVTVVFTFFPAALPVTGPTMNWSCAVYGGVILIGIFYYIVRGRNTYRCPVI